MSDAQALADDSRGAGRRSIYVGAVLSGEIGTLDVRIRNMSATGALIESRLLPSPGQTVVLVRGGLSADALVVWSDRGRSGLKFATSVDVPCWLSVQDNAEQQRVDALVRLVRTGANHLSLGSAAAQMAQPALADAADPPHANLQQLICTLKSLSGDLSDDPHILQLHGGTLQRLDICLQGLSAIAAQFRDLQSAGRAPQ